jgi:hypothetical protein
MLFDFDSGRIPHVHVKEKNIQLFDSRNLSKSKGSLGDKEFAIRTFSKASLPLPFKKADSTLSAFEERI